MPEHYADEIPAECLKDELNIDACAVCGAPFEEFGYLDPADAKCYCLPCLDKGLAPLVIAAEQFAQKECEITRPLPPFYADLEYRCSPEDYDSGARESYTENSYRTMLRHHYTNYDGLIKDCDRNSIRGRVFCAAIRERINFLIDEAIDENELIRDSLDDEVDDDE